MNKFSKLSDLLNTTDGMTVLRNNTGQDDGVDSVSGADWFVFNGAVASTLYVSGNSFVGFGSSSEHLKVCRRDGKMWYLYRQEGIVGLKKFLKLRWEGYSRYNSSTSTYALKGELFLFDDGGMYLNVIDVPDDSSYIGTSALICGSNTLNIPIAVSTPVTYSLLLENGAFALSDKTYPGTENKYIGYGTFECQVECFQNDTDITRGLVAWDEKIPEGTSISVCTRLSSGEYVKCSNGGEIAGIVPGVDLSSEILNVKIEMTTSDTYSTPELSNLTIHLFKASYARAIVLHFEDGMRTSIRNAVGSVSVQYVGTTLLGEQGPVLGFKKSFVPEGLYMKPNPHDPEHVEIITASMAARLTRMEYKSVSSAGEHVTIVGAAKSAILTHIDHL